MAKRLIINADDYGTCPEVNRSIEYLITQGRLKNVSVAANTAFSAGAFQFLRNQKDCSVGIHLNIVEGTPVSFDAAVRPIVGAGGEFLPRNRLLARWVTSPRAVLRACEVEWRSQIELLARNDITITHADSHQHIHAFPPFWNLLVRLCEEYGIPAVRTPQEMNSIKRRTLPAYLLSRSSMLAGRMTRQTKIRTNDHLLGFKRAGSYLEHDLLADLKNLKEGVTELICHPSMQNGVPYADYLGGLEHRALAGTAVWDEVASLGIELTTWQMFAEEGRE